MQDVTRFVARRLREAADPRKAVGMAAYMKTDMPFYGVQKPARQQIWRDLRARLDCPTRAAWQAAVLALWARPHREEKYLALQVARGFPRYHTVASMPLFRRLVVEGAWWDLVDETATKLVGAVLLEHRAKTRPILDGWIDHRDMWVRRTAIISQVGHKTATDEKTLYAYGRRRAHEKAFFIRKAIGWSLRDYAWTDPDSVRRFLERHGHELSGLSFREAAKNLDPTPAK